MISGTVQLYTKKVERFVHISGVLFLNVDYRLAPVEPKTAMAEDVLKAVLWLKENGKKLGVDPERIALMGDSGGGAVAAGAAILVSDRKIGITRQILLYPMLDDRNATPDPYIAPFMTFG